MRELGFAQNSHETAIFHKNTLIWLRFQVVFIENKIISIDFKGERMKAELKRELNALCEQEALVDSHEFRAWMEKAANYLHQDQLRPGEKFVFNENTKCIEKAFIN